MKQIKFKGLMVTIAICMLQTIHAQVSIDGIEYRFNNASSEATVVGAIDREMIIIPEVVENEGKTYKVTRIEKAFTKCNLLSSIKLPNSVKEIDDSFEECNNLETITIPNSVTKLDKSFRKCDKLKSITIPNGINKIFAVCNDCNSLTSVEILEGVSEITNSFMDCHNLVSIKLPNSLTNINFSFARNNSTSITIPKNVNKIVGSLISNNLKKIIIQNPIPPKAYDFFHDEKELEIELIVPKGSLAAYKSSSSWKFMTNISEMR
jgi:hypothetical protein